MHLGRLFSAEKRSELARFDLWTRLKNYPERWKLGVTEAISATVFGHCVGSIIGIPRLLHQRVVLDRPKGG